MTISKGYYTLSYTFTPTSSKESKLLLGCVWFDKKYFKMKLFFGNEIIFKC